MSIFLIVALLVGAQYTPVTKYDPNRSAEQDLKNAVVEANRTGKHILLEVGGDWCSWCHIMDRYFDQNPGLTALR
ncbi:MAG TPA: thioredoxin family protein, partial [Terriglobia bacterium]|nr:thioredoxin family protein [Terriglobia bacterium]